MSYQALLEAAIEVVDSGGAAHPELAEAVEAVLAGRERFTFACPSCGSPNVWSRAWVQLNTDDVASALIGAGVSSAADGLYWCEACKRWLVDVCHSKDGACGVHGESSDGEPRCQGWKASV